MGGITSGIGGMLGSGQTGMGGMFGGGALGGLFGGSGPLAEAFGLEKKQGEYFQPQTGNQGLDQLNAENMSLTDKGYNQKLADVQSGKMSTAQGMEGLDRVQREGMNTDGVVGSRIAGEEVANNPLYSNLFGAGGLNSRLNDEEQRLASTGYGMQGADHEAYGQASGDISRQFGQQEQDASKMLARRGLGGGASGAAGATFSGLAGNKNEMLAKAQTDIAQKRMADTTSRLQNTRNMMGSLGTQAGQLQQSQYDRQLAGAKNRQQNVTNAAQLQSGANASNNAMQFESTKDKRGSMGKSLLEGLGQGMFSSSQQIGASPGTGASSFSSSMGSTLGSGGGGMMASDEDNKENIEDGTPEIQGFLDSLGTHKYDYKPSAKGLFGAGEGEHYSPMAQELEETPVGESMVNDTPDGKVVDYGKGFGALASGLGEINERLKRLEGGR